jgi:hypothetical protein
MLFDRYRQGCVKRAHAVVSTPLFAVGVLLALYGVFALTYNGDGGSTTVTLTGHQLDAHLVGGVSVAIGLIVVGLGIWIARGRSLGS